MPINHDLNLYNDDAQRQLYRQLVDEFVQLYGFDCQYVPRQSISGVDLLFGDDPTKYFAGAYPIVVLVLNATNFDGGDLFSKLAGGLIIQKTVRLLMSQDGFQQTTQGTLGPRPREGDLVWLRPFQALYEIKYVNQDKLFYAFGNARFYGYELQCEEFRYNNEVVQTSVPEIQSKVASVIAAYAANVANGTVTYTIGEQVYQGSNLASATATATVLTWNLPTGNLVLTATQGTFEANANVIGANSGASWMLNSINVLDSVNDQLMDNTLVGEEANGVINWTPENPFGEPTQD